MKQIKIEDVELSDKQRENLQEFLSDEESHEEMEELLREFNNREKKYINGWRNLVKKNETKAINKLSEAANKNHPAALILLHILWKNNPELIPNEIVNIIDNREKIKDLFFHIEKKVLDKQGKIRCNKPDLFICLYWGYENGIGTSRDLNKADQFLSQLKEDYPKYYKRFSKELSINLTANAMDEKIEQKQLITDDSYELDAKKTLKKNTLFPSADLNLKNVSDSDFFNSDSDSDSDFDSQQYSI